MTVTERERRVSELMYGGIYREELCRMVAMREHELDEIKSKHEEMRSAMQAAMRELGKVVA